MHGVDLQVETASSCVFVGPSGCGKSTLLRVIAGLEDSNSAATSVLDGQARSTTGAAQIAALAMVFQSYALYPHMSVRQNLAFGLENARMPRAEDRRARAARRRRCCRSSRFSSASPRQLSGGQRQRVAIGRAIVRRPGIFLFDEPLSNLDAELRVADARELAALHQPTRHTMIYVTHDQVEAMTMADRIVVLRDGRSSRSGAARALQSARQPVRRRLHRLAADELRRRPHRCDRRRRHRRRHRRPADAAPAGRRQKRAGRAEGDPGRRARSACGARRGPAVLSRRSTSPSISAATAICSVRCRAGKA